MDSKTGLLKSLEDCLNAFTTCPSGLKDFEDSEVCYLFFSSLLDILPLVLTLCVFLFFPPGADQELRNVIDKLAQFVARNGPEFEKMTMEKQKDNPKFSFLFGGEYFSYYKCKLAMEQQQRM